MEVKVLKALSEGQIETVFSHINDICLLLDREGVVKYANQAFFDTFQIPKDSFDGKIQNFLLGKRNKSFLELYTEILEGQMTDGSKVVKYTTEDNVKLHFEVEVLNVAEIEKSHQYETLIVIKNASERYRLAQLQHDCANIFASLIIGISLYIGTWTLCKFTLQLKLTTADYTKMIEGITFILFLEILFFTSFSLKDVGLVPQKKRIVRNGLWTIIIGIITCGLLLLGRIYMVYNGIPGKSYFIGGSISGAVSYILTATIQEFLARGVMQTSVKYLMNVRFQKTISVLLTSMLFSLMHLPFGFLFMLGAFLLSIALGTIYERQGDLWGCALLHWGCGYLAMALFF